MPAKRLAFLRAAFDRFARVEAPGLASPTYEELSYGVSNDDDLARDRLAHPAPRQPPPNMLFAAVQYLLLNGLNHPLAAHYPIISSGPRPLAPAYPHFREFCLEQRERIVELISTRLTQTNVVRRCACLLPAFSIVCRETSSPLALIDLGASAGLNLNFDRYAYSYKRNGREILRWGSDSAQIRLEAELQGRRRIASNSIRHPRRQPRRYRSRSGRHRQSRPTPMAARPDLARARRAPPAVDPRGDRIQGQRYPHAHRRCHPCPAGVDRIHSLRSTHWLSTPPSRSTSFPGRVVSASPTRSPPPARKGPSGRPRLKGMTRNCRSPATGTVQARRRCWQMRHRMVGGSNGRPTRAPASRTVNNRSEKSGNCPSANAMVSRRRFEATAAGLAVPNSDPSRQPRRVRGRWFALPGLLCFLSACASAPAKPTLDLGRFSAQFLQEIVERAGQLEEDGPRIEFLSRQFL